MGRERERERERDTDRHAAGGSQMEWNGFKMVRKKAAGSRPLYSVILLTSLFI